MQKTAKWDRCVIPCTFNCAQKCTSSFLTTHIHYKYLKKVKQVMKLYVILFFAAITQLNANSTAQTVTLRIKTTSLKSVMESIKKQTGYGIIYVNNAGKGALPIAVTLYDVPLVTALEEIMKGQSLNYQITEKNIIISTKPDLADRLSKRTEETQHSSAIVKGRVTDSSGTPIRASIQVKGKTTGQTTDDAGSFTINATEGDILIISSVGYITREIKVENISAILVITLLPQSGEIENIVVTALGIKRAERALAYHVQELKSADLTRNKDANFVNALAGKIAGVTINSSSSGIGGSTRVIMRGTKSITQNNNVLYVIDGMPIPNANNGGSSDAFYALATTEGISSINPEDIESISALTGPSAAALYGNQGANGVIIVNTKKGQAGKVKVALSHSSDFYQPFVMPRFQRTYGQTAPGDYSSWGAKLSTPSNYKPKDFFETGTNIFNAVSLSGGTEKSQTFFSAGSNNANGIIRNNTYNRYNFFLRHTVNFTSRLTTDFNAMYIRQDDKNMVAQGQYHNPIIPIYLFPPGNDIDQYKVYARYDPNRRLYTQFWPYGDLGGLGAQNPYWVTDAENNLNKRNRYIFSVTAKYNVTDWLSVTGRVRIDNSTIEAERKYPAGTATLFASQYGFYGTEKITTKNTYADLIATIQHRITPALRFTSNIGGSYLDDKSDGINSYGNLTKLANFYSTLENMDPIVAQSYSHTQLQSVFATAQFEYNRWLYLDATGRYEWPSQLPEKFAAKSSYFYPSVGLSAVLSDLLELKNTTLSFVKIRASYAEVGNPPKEGIVNPTFSLINENFRPAPYREYQPERTRSFELGAEVKLFQQRLSLNATVYQSNTVNQLLSQPINTGGQYTVFYFNAGNIRNKGIEASLGFNTTLKDVSWTTNAVFSLNRNKVVRLSEGFQNPYTKEISGKDSLNMSSLGDLQNILIVGGSMADLYVSQLLREDNQGDLFVDPGSGSIGKVTLPEKRFIGRTTPDYNIGWRNSFTYKSLTLSFLIDARLGGVGVSFTQSVMDAFGVSERSAEDRDRGGVRTLNGKLFQNVMSYYNMLGAASGGSVGMPAYYVYDATNVRLREASLAYTLPYKLLGGALQNLELALTGRNLFMFYNKAPFDPESTASTGTYYQGVDYFQQPSYRSFGFSIKAQF
jgi:TonB-linked SusC/RagA family outer membrane protein